MSRWQADYIRVVVQGRLIALAPLHVGSGDEEEYSLGQQPEGDLEPGLVNTLLRDATGRPYIPGSTLRGLLRGLLRARCDHPHLPEILFGEARQKVDEKRQVNWPGHAGQLRVYDATFDGGGPIDRVSRTGIDPLTGAARQHHLATHEVVPPGTGFHLRLELDHVGDRELQALLGCLELLGNDPDSQLGKGKSIGQGWVEWRQGKVSVLRRTRLQDFLRQAVPNPADRAGSPRNRGAGLPQAGRLKRYWETITPVPEGGGQNRWRVFDFELLPKAPVLINDPHRVDKTGREDSPDMVYHRRPDGRAEIPGSTLKGWARGWCRRILLTLQTQPDEARVEALLAELFGSTGGGMGLLRFESALAETTVTHRQTFNAIDRFSGGVKAGALYSVEAAWPDRFAGRLHVRLDKTPDWARLLLLYLLRDAEEGDLVIGWGKARGYGKLKLKQNRIHWQRWARKGEPLKRWHRELQAALKPAVEETAS